MWFLVSFKFPLGILFNKPVLLKNDFLVTSLQVNTFFSFLNAFVSESFVHTTHRPSRETCAQKDSRDMPFPRVGICDRWAPELGNWSSWWGCLQMRCVIAGQVSGASPRSPPVVLECWPSGQIELHRNGVCGQPWESLQLTSV